MNGEEVSELREALASVLPITAIVLALCVTVAPLPVDVNGKEVSELRRRFRPEKSAVSRVYGCYVNGSSREIISYLDESSRPRRGTS